MSADYWHPCRYGDRVPDGAFLFIRNSNGQVQLNITQNSQWFDKGLWHTKKDAWQMAKQLGMKELSK